MTLSKFGVFMSYSCTGGTHTGQDRFAYNHAGRANNKTFLDIGAAHPFYASNTYALELMGWRGLAVDKARHEHWNAFRTTTLISNDALKVDWQSVAGKYFLLGAPNDICHDVFYLSLDCEEDTTAILEKLLPVFRFQCATIEHNFYLYGDGPRTLQRAMMQGAGYTLTKADVTFDGKPFEDWWTL